MKVGTYPSQDVDLSRYAQLSPRSARMGYHDGSSDEARLSGGATGSDVEGAEQRGTGDCL